ncbi:MAG: hypothetical protein P1V81_16520 [Planctomycetota bacterium]|nr:hypothetical protein [Planctomycetota bacterium]
MASARRKTSARRTEEPAPARRPVRRPSSGGPPTGLIIAGLLVGLAVLGWAFMSSTNKGSSASTMIFAAEKALADGMSSNDVNTKLKKAEADSGVTAEQRIRINELRALLKERDKQTALDVHNSVGTVFVEKKLRNYSQKYLEGDPEPAKARVFLERCKEFHERWPEHQETDWVERQERRFKTIVDLSQPPTLADVTWKAEALTYAKPRDYTMAFRALDSFIAGASAEDKLVASNYKLKLQGERDEYHVDRMLQAQFEFETNNDEGKAIAWLVHGVIGAGDQAMSDEAADYLLKMPSAAEYLRGYKSKQPLVFERLLEHPAVKAFAADNDI